MNKTFDNSDYKERVIEMIAKLKRLSIVFLTMVLCLNIFGGTLSVSGATTDINLTKGQNYVKHYSSKKTGRQHINFKFNLSDGATNIRMALLGTKTATFFTGYNTFMDVLRSASGVVGTGTEINDYSIANKRNIQPNTDYEVDIWIDMDRRIINYYFNGEYWATINFADTFTELWGYAFSATNPNETSTSKVVASVKDFELTKFTYKANGIYDTDAMPEYLKETPAAYYTTDEIGNIFTDPTQVKFNELIQNRLSTSKEYKREISIIAEDGEEIYKTADEISLSGGCKNNSTISFDMTKAKKQYGIFKLKVVFRNKDDDEIASSSERDFSVIKSSGTLNKKLGINVHFGHYQGGNPINNMTLIKNAGFSSARDFVDYSSYNGSIGFTRYNRWKDYAKSYGIDRTIILMGYDTATYGGVFPTTDAGRDNYTAYASGAAKTLNGDAAILELWNEMDWQTTSENYAKMLINAVPKIKKQNSTSKIAVMCTARSRANERNWIKGVIDYIKNQGLNPKDYMDIISIHPYTRNVMPEQNGCECGMENDSAGNIKAGVEALRSMLDEMGLSDVELIATEMGFYSTPENKDTGAWNGGKHHDALTEKQQAEYSVRVAAMLHRTLDHMQFYAINKPQDASASEAGFGLTRTYTGIESPYEAKPVYVALSAFNSLLCNAKVVQETTSGDCNDYIFEKAEGAKKYKIHLAWTTDANSRYVYPIDADAVEVYDIYGNKSYMTRKSGEIRIPLGTSPIYFRNAEFVVLDENNLELTQDSKKATAYATIDEETSSEFAYANGTMLIVAAYKDGVLTNVSVKNTDSNGSIKTDEIDITNADEVKAFLWKNNKPIKSMYENQR